MFFGPYRRTTVSANQPANMKSGPLAIKLCINKNNHRYLDVLTIKVLRLIETVCV